MAGSHRREASLRAHIYRRSPIFRMLLAAGIASSLLTVPNAVSGRSSVGASGPSLAPRMQPLLSSSTPSVTFTSGTGYSSGWVPLNVALGDVSGDGKPDIVTPNGSADSVSTLLNVAGGSFTQPATLSPAGVAVDQIALGDVNGDGKRDAAIVSGTPTVSVMLSNGDGTFGAETSVQTLPDDGELCCPGRY